MDNINHYLDDNDGDDDDMNELTVRNGDSYSTNHAQRSKCTCKVIDTLALLTNEKTKVEKKNSKSTAAPATSKISTHPSEPGAHHPCSPLFSAVPRVPTTQQVHHPPQS